MDTHPDVVVAATGGKPERVTCPIGSNISSWGRRSGGWVVFVGNDARGDEFLELGLVEWLEIASVDGVAVVPADLERADSHRRRARNDVDGKASLARFRSVLTWTWL